LLFIEFIAQIFGVKKGAQLFSNWFLYTKNSKIIMKYDGEFMYFVIIYLCKTFFNELL